MRDLNQINHFFVIKQSRFRLFFTVAENFCIPSPPIRTNSGSADESTCQLLIVNKGHLK